MFPTVLSPMPPPKSVAADSGMFSYFNPLFTNGFLFLVCYGPLFMLRGHKL